MQVAVLDRPNDPLSLRLYQHNMVRELSALSVEISFFPESGPIPACCDLVWDPGMCMRRIPPVLGTTTVPVVGTMHGVKAFALDVDELVIAADERQSLLALKAQVLEDWNWFRHIVKAVVAVSNYAKDEVVQAFGLPSDLVRVVYHGVDRSVFHPNGVCINTELPYFLHVSRMDPVKNLRRILEAYSILQSDNRPEFVALVTPEEDQPALTREFSQLARRHAVTWVSDLISQEKLASWYRGALALVAPSLRETFGLPIIEAMACGCPVITSHSTGCAEIAGNAALLVNPRSVDEITIALRRLLKEDALRHVLRDRGIARVIDFSWQKSGDQIVELFHTL